MKHLGESLVFYNLIETQNVFFFVILLMMYILYLLEACGGGVVASWLVHLTLDSTLVWVQDLAGDIAVPLSTQVYKWVPVNLMLGVTLRWTSIPSRGE